MSLLEDDREEHGVVGVPGDWTVPGELTTHADGSLTLCTQPRHGAILYAYNTALAITSEQTTNLAETWNT